MSTREKKILVVEDDRSLAMAIRAKLEHRGFAVLSASSVPEALSHLARHGRVDAIWLDHYFKGEKSGLDLVTTLKSDSAEWKNIPVFVVSNTASADTVKSYKRLGIEDFFIKAETRLEHIVSKIQRAMKT